MSMPGLFAEMRRRHVWRVAIAYLVAGWLLVQVATQVFPFFEIPNWAVRLVVVLVVIGMPLALVLAWVYEITPDGIRRTEPTGSPGAMSRHQHRRIARRLDATIIAVLAIGVAVLGWRAMAERSARIAMAGKLAAAAPPASASGAAKPDAGAAVPAIPAKSVAVLPFENLNGDSQDAYFVAGMQDLILIKLAEIGDLKVISRTSTVQYASKPENLKKVGQQLGVATILEGSVQKSGNQVLVTVQLIDAGSDSHLWGQSYQRTLDNVFGVEGEVAEKIAQALKSRLSPAETANLALVPTHNSEAYDLFLRAEYQTSLGDVNYDTARIKASIPLYRQAAERDPGFALAFARLSTNESLLAWFGGGGEEIAQLNQHARADAERALQLQPDLATAHLALGFSEYWGRGDYDAALNAFSEALRLKPNDAEALAARGYVERRQGRFTEAVASLRDAFALNPRGSALAYETGVTYMLAGNFVEVDRWLQRALALDPANRNAKIELSNALVFTSGDIPGALAVVAGEDPELQLQRVTLLGYQHRYADALALLEAVPDSPDNFQTPNVPPKEVQQAELHQRLGDTERARRLFARALPGLRAQRDTLQGINRAFGCQYLAMTELGLGHTAEGVAAVAESQAIVDRGNDHMYGPARSRVNAALYVKAGRPDLGMPLLERALAAPGISRSYSPVLLWIDPAWDPVRNDPRFEALLAKYARYKPAVLYDAPRPP